MSARAPWTRGGPLERARSGRLAVGGGLAVAAAASIAAATSASPLAAQDGPGAASSYVDETARALHEAAMDAQARFDDTVLRYTAVVRQRIAAQLRTPLKDRTLYRMESAHRVFWSRDGENVVQVLGVRQQTPVGVDDVDAEFVRGMDFFDNNFDPLNDRLLFFGDTRDEDGAEDLGEPDRDEFWFEHPLYPRWVRSYRFSTGDTLSLSLPDGRVVRAVELVVIPERADVHRLAGSLWIEPETGNLVRAVYRLSDTFDAFRDVPDLREEEDDDLRFVPGIFKPWTVEISMIAVDYALWDFEVWLPRSMRLEGVIGAGILKAPVTFDVAYETEAVTTEASAEAPPDPAVPVIRFETRSEAMAYLNELAYGAGVTMAEDPAARFRDGRRIRYLVPEEPGFLAESADLPPPVWEDAPGFASTDELEDMFDHLAGLPVPPVVQVPSTLRWGLQRPDLVRYNRVEALSLGARWQWRPQSPIGPLTVGATGRLGFDLEPNARLDLTRETLRRKVVLGGYNELAPIDEGARHLGIGNSAMAALFGRDDGDYYRRSGAALEINPPSARRASYRVRAYSEYQREAPTHTDFALFSDWGDSTTFRPAFPAAEGWEHGLMVELAPWWGTDPNLVQGGVELFAQGGVGEREYGRGALTARTAIPLPAALRLGLEAGGGATWGDPALQRLWYLGGPRTLRGYDPLVLGGERYLRARAELARRYAFGGVSLFWDAGWAGLAGERVDLDGALHSTGIGLSLLDGLLRLDAAFGLREPTGFRLELYLDGVL